MLSRFFINRPIFATVLSILIVVAGVVTLRSLPVEQYPTITPPTVVVEAQYPGRSTPTSFRRRLPWRSTTPARPPKS